MFRFTKLLRYFARRSADIRSALRALLMSPPLADGMGAGFALVPRRAVRFTTRNVS